MNKGIVFITDYGFKDVSQEIHILRQGGYEVDARRTSSEEEIIKSAANADALLVQWAPINARIIQALGRCRIIVRYGIGVDNVDLVAAKQKGIIVCNIPDYCIHEVADHTVALALALGRQLAETRNQVSQGTWQIIPPFRMPAFRDMTFTVIGYGRIAREVLKRVKPFGFKLAAHDPYVSKDRLEADDVCALDFADALSMSDILSLHLPLTAATHHLINGSTIALMKEGAILINTSRGGLIAADALAQATSNRRIVAGLDVFEFEPLSANDPLARSPHVALTSHTAWYSERSVPELQRLAAEEALRGLEGQPLSNRLV